MSEKTIHVVFQILNFLSHLSFSEKYKLTSVEKLVLLFLGKHKGIKGIYPSIKTLARELQLSISTIKRTLKSLRDKKLLSMDYILGKTTHYTLLVPSCELSTTQVIAMTPVAGVTPVSELRPEGGVIAVTLHPGHSCDPLSERRSNKKEERERKRKRRAAPLTDDFELTQATSEKIDELGFEEDEANLEIEKFMNYYMEKGEEKSDWNLILQNWMINAKSYKKGRKVTQKQDEVRSIVPWFNPEHAPVNIPKPNGHGGHINGLGHKRTRKT